MPFQQFSENTVLIAAAARVINVAMVVFRQEQTWTWWDGWRCITAAAVGFQTSCHILKSNVIAVSSMTSK